jgi:hypothetical protein
MKMIGHLTNSMFKRYNITSAADIREASKKLDAFHKTQSSNRCNGNSTRAQFGHSCTRLGAVGQK